MSIEGYHRGYNPGLTPRNAEDPFGRGTEARGNRGIENTPERENSHWLSGFITPENVERAKEYPLCEGWSTEWHIYQRLLGVLVESGPGLSPVTRKRLRNEDNPLSLLQEPNP